ncbi:MAG: imidazolonepropionase [Phycisphaerales bacterium]|nr:imidazolonepropionase [Phycisphaerales bacterium]
MSDTSPPTTLIIRNARVVTSPGAAGSAVRGEALGELDITERADVTITAGRITKVTKKGIKGPRDQGIKKSGTSDSPPSSRSLDPSMPRSLSSEIDAAGRVLMAGFVDCHTHACWAGSRLDEWDQKRRGVPYLKILAAGGGIMATVRAVRDASLATLTDLLLERVNRMLALGSTTIEVKSGYGLNTETELKMLRAVRAAQERFPGTLIPTALLGHAIDDTQPGFVGRVIRETLPVVAAEFPGIAVDAYVEKGAWSVDQALLLFARARDLHLPIRVHADQFNSLGMVPAAIKLGARSIDHLEATTRGDLDALAESDTFGVMLPACGFHLKAAYARGSHFTQHAKGGKLCIATNFNPGSAPCPSMAMTIAIAVRHLGLSPQEAITAATANPASLLGLNDRGRVAVGQRGDLLLLRESDERSVAFGFGDSQLERVICGGKII